MSCLPSGSYTIIDLPARISSEPGIQQAIFDQYAARLSLIEHDYLVDMDKVRHLSSPILALITRLHATAVQRGCHLSIVNAHQPLWEALLSVKVDRSIPMYPTFLDYEIEKMDPALMAA